MKNINDRTIYFSKSQTWFNNACMCYFIVVTSRTVARNAWWDSLEPWRAAEEWALVQVTVGVRRSGADIERQLAYCLTAWR